MSARTIQEISEEYTAQWMATPGVVSTAVGESEGRPCIKVFLAKKTEEVAAQFPNSVEGHQVILEETGEFRAQHG